MNSLGERLSRLPHEERQYLLSTLSIHLYESKKFEQLFALIEDTQWYKSKIYFDVSTVSYAQDVQFGIQAAEAQGLEGLPRVVAYSLLLATLSVCPQNI